MHRGDNLILGGKRADGTKSEWSIEVVDGHLRIRNVTEDVVIFTTEDGPVMRRAERQADELPPGYRLDGGKGGYWGVYGPVGQLQGGSNGKFHGRDTAVDAAWADYKGV